jgi:hypothetical protein
MFGWAPGLGVRVLESTRVDNHWTILALTEGLGVCPSCGGRSTHRHGWHERHLQDLPAQGASVTLKLRMRRWRCCNKACERQTFVERLPEIVTPFARRTRRAAELLHLFGHGVGGRPGERLLERIGMPTSDDTILGSMHDLCKIVRQAKNLANSLSFKNVRLRMSCATTRIGANFPCRILFHNSHQRQSSFAWTVNVRF